MSFLKSRRIGKRRLAALIRFCRKNGQLLLMVLLVMCGAVLGCITFSMLDEETRLTFMSVLQPSVMPLDIVDGCYAVIGAVFGTVIMLALLFLLGLTAFGCPLILPIPVFYGFCIGVSECQAYAAGGMTSAFFDVVLPLEIGAVAIMIAALQALKMSCTFSRQLLPGGAHCGGIWQSFKRYLLRFFLCIAIAFLAAVVQVVIMVLF